MSVRKHPRPRVAIPIESTQPYRHHLEPLAGIRRFAREHTDWITVVDPFVTDVRGQGYDGVVGRLTPAIASAAKAAGVPMVNLWTNCQEEGVPNVFPDCVTGGRLAAEYLMNKGYRRFAYMGPKKAKGCRWAREGFLTSLEANNFPCLKLQVHDDFEESPKHWTTFLEQVADFVQKFDPPVAMFAPFDNFCRYVAEACHQIGLSIPHDVALLGFGDDMAICLQPEPTLSSINANMERIGFEAAALLDRLMKGEPPPKAPIYVDLVGIISRQSTDNYASYDPLVSKALHFIIERLRQPLRVGQVADHVGSTVRTLDRHFLNAMGRTATEEIARQRLDLGKRLLLETSDPIKMVANDCGFSDFGYFTQVFHKAVGLTPGEFRRQRKGRRSRA